MSRHWLVNLNRLGTLGAMRGICQTLATHDAKVAKQKKDCGFHHNPFSITKRSKSLLIPYAYSTADD